jgi:hypothetical protein
MLILPFRRTGNINAPCTISINPINANAVIIIVLCINRQLFIAMFNTGDG